MTETPNPNAVLYAKLARITAGAARVPKNGYNKHQNYYYVTERDLIGALHGLMGQENLCIFSRVINVERIAHPNERMGPITQVYMVFTLACGDTGATIELPWVAEGQDTGDKGLNKAYTNALKYFLMKTFLVATGDDVEQDTPQPQPQTHRLSSGGSMTINDPPAPRVSLGEAWVRFWSHWEPTLGGKDWKRINEMLDREVDTPQTVEQLKALHHDLDAVMTREAAKANAER